MLEATMLSARSVGTAAFAPEPKTSIGPTTILKPTPIATYIKAPMNVASSVRASITNLCPIMPSPSER
jgi:hypothetical protein